MLTRILCLVFLVLTSACGSDSFRTSTSLPSTGDDPTNQPPTAPDPGNPNQPPTEPPTNPGAGSSTDYVVFIADRTEFDKNEIFRVDYDGSNLTKLSGTMPSNADAYMLSLTNDKSKLAYISDKDSNDVLDLYVKDLSTNTEITINNVLGINQDIKDFLWSPDNTHIAYLLDETLNDVFELYVANADGSTNIKVSSSLSLSKDIKSFAWNHDGSKLAYITDQDTNDIYELYIVDVDGQNQIKVSDTLVTDGVVDSFKWSPDGTKIAYIADQETAGIKEVYISTISGPSVIKVSDTVFTNLLDELEGTNKTISWSPDSTKISYLATQASPTDFELYTVNVDGTGKIKISADGLSSGDTIDHPSWINNSNVIYTGKYFETISTVTRLINVKDDATNEIDLSGILVDEGDVIGAYVLSPDGQKICYRADKEINNKTELFSVNIDGTNPVKVSSSTLPSNGDVSDEMAWSPDNLYIAYIADQEYDAVKELFITKLSDLSNQKISDEMVSFGEVKGFIFAGSHQKNKISIGSLPL